MESPSLFYIHREARIHFAGLYVLKNISEDRDTEILNSEDPHKELSLVLKHLETSSYIKKNDLNTFTMTKNGKNHLDFFLGRYAKFTQKYDIFSGVDVDRIDFALSYYRDFYEEQKWESFLNEERWKDLRVAIAEYQGFDAIELTFMRFIHNESYTHPVTDWRYDQLLGPIWEEIQTTCNNSVRLKSLLSSKKEKHFKEILIRGRQLLQQLSKPS